MFVSFRFYVYLFECAILIFKQFCYVFPNNEISIIAVYDAWIGPFRVLVELLHLQIAAHIHRLHMFSKKRIKIFFSYFSVQNITIIKQ